MVALSAQLHWSTGYCESWAVFSPCHTWRYRLVRVWDSDKPRLAWVIRNGSEADERRSDATIRRCMSFARAWGYGGVDIGHLYGLVSKKPDAFTKAHSDPVGPDNDIHLGAVCSQNDLTVLAWGPNADTERVHAVVQMLSRHANRRGGSLAVLDWTRGAQPLHPLLAPQDATLKCLTLSGPDCCFHETEDPRWGHLVAGAA
ncbi:DUF1643 domain-containing protein [Mycobacterium botniense]|uniref:DUF1643 domain-containing protein n=1 Tax=Mycobacterium botniense TaxID=84962 RepID=A0A7I9Y334_9MYCO|nr:DUF1643 domain-containing protein [Mycobacterium botniense]GFG76486.1 hypothetical protein MBOT_38510 [Mycobacterium botniense]